MSTTYYNGTITTANTITTGGTITIIGGSGGGSGSGSSSGTGGSITITSGTGGYIAYNNYATKAYVDGYSMYYQQPKQATPIDILIDDLKTSLLGELDKYCDALDNNAPPTDQNFDKLVTMAEYNMALFNISAELIKERLDKLKSKTNKFLTEDVD